MKSARNKKVLWCQEMLKKIHLNFALLFLIEKVELFFVSQA